MSVIRVFLNFVVVSTILFMALVITGVVKAEEYRDRPAFTDTIDRPDFYGDFETLKLDALMLAMVLSKTSNEAIAALQASGLQDKLSLAGSNGVVQAQLQRYIRELPRSQFNVLVRTLKEWSRSWDVKKAVIASRLLQHILPTGKSRGIVNQPFQKYRLVPLT